MAGGKGKGRRKDKRGGGEAAAAPKGDARIDGDDTEGASMDDLGPSSDEGVLVENLSEQQQEVVEENDEDQIDSAVEEEQFHDANDEAEEYADPGLSPQAEGEAEDAATYEKEGQGSQEDATDTVDTPVEDVEEHPQQEEEEVAEGENAGQPDEEADPRELLDDAWGDEDNGENDQQIVPPVISSRMAATKGTAEIEEAGDAAGGSSPGSEGEEEETGQESGGWGGGWGLSWASTALKSMTLVTDLVTDTAVGVASEVTKHAAELLKEETFAPRKLEAVASASPDHRGDAVDAGARSGGGGAQGSSRDEGGATQSSRAAVTDDSGRTNDDASAALATGRLSASGGGGAGSSSAGASSSASAWALPDRARGALDRMEGGASASATAEEGLLDQGFRLLDDSVDSLATGALKALGSAWKGGWGWVHKIEDWAERTASDGGAAATSAGAKSRELGGDALESIGRRALGALLNDGGEGSGGRQGGGSAAGVAGDGGKSKPAASFKSSFYVYGGHEFLEELESLSNAATVRCNRARGKLSPDDRAAFDAAMASIRSALRLDVEHADEEEGAEELAGGADGQDGENQAALPGQGGGDASSSGTSSMDARVGRSFPFLAKLRRAAVHMAEQMAAECEASLGAALDGGAGEGGAAVPLGDLMRAALDKLEAIRNEGMERLAELCSLCVAHLLLLAQSLSASALSDEPPSASGPLAGLGVRGDALHWPPSPEAKASLVGGRARAMAREVEALVEGFSENMARVAAAVAALLADAASGDDKEGAGGQMAEAERKARAEAVEQRSAALCDELAVDSGAGSSHLQDGALLLLYVILETAIPSAA